MQNEWFAANLGTRGLFHAFSISEKCVLFCFAFFCIRRKSRKTRTILNFWLSDGAVIVPRLHGSAELSLAQALERGVFDCKMNCVKFTWLPAAPGSLLEPGACL